MTGRPIDPLGPARAIVAWAIVMLIVWAVLIGLASLAVAR